MEGQDGVEHVMVPALIPVTTMILIKMVIVQSVIIVGLSYAIFIALGDSVIDVKAMGILLPIDSPDMRI